MTAVRLVLILSFLSVRMVAFDDLGSDQLAALTDSKGWEYITVDDSQDGFPTQHVCFDGQPHPDACSGTLTLTQDQTFAVDISIHHQSVVRHGTYELDGDQLTFSDEFGTRDGPYTIAIDLPNNVLTMQTAEVKIKLQLYKEYRKQMDEKNKNKQKQPSDAPAS
jgi:hypothetical protein